MVTLSLPHTSRGCAVAACGSHLPALLRAPHMEVWGPRRSPSPQPSPLPLLPRLPARCPRLGDPATFVGDRAWHNFLSPKQGGCPSSSGVWKWASNGPSAGEGPLAALVRQEGTPAEPAAPQTPCRDGSGPVRCLLLDGSRGREGPRGGGPASGPRRSGLGTPQSRPFTLGSCRRSAPQRGLLESLMLETSGAWLP